MRATRPPKASPFFPAQEWEEAKRTLSEDVFRQEYMAEFLEDSAGVFRGIDACLFDAGTEVSGQGSAVSGKYHRNVVIGCDVAKHTDWTVLIAMDAETGRCFAMERFNQLDWPIQKERIVGFARRWRGRVILDATGIGDPIYDDLKRVLPDIEPYKLTAGSKTDLVQRLIVAVEQRQVSWPAGREVRGQKSEGSGKILATDCADFRGLGAGNWDVLTTEMKRFEYEIRPAGGITYGAPAGYHDDCVMSLALANHGRWEAASCGHMLRVSDPYGPNVGRFRRRDHVLTGL